MFGLKLMDRRVGVGVRVCVCVCACVCFGFDCRLGAAERWRAWGARGWGPNEKDIGLCMCACMRCMCMCARVVRLCCE